mmetsp:Transcript_99339/g.206934  ORF Transcript_99339/g.206934 Transcript_99339/m.206934 type:complete len:172 (+) Transcript_99339:255-770(+)
MDLYLFANRSAPDILQCRRIFQDLADRICGRPCRCWNLLLNVVRRKQLKKPCVGLVSLVLDFAVAVKEHLLRELGFDQQRIQQYGNLLLWMLMQLQRSCWLQLQMHQQDGKALQASSTGRLAAGLADLCLQKRAWICCWCSSLVRHPAEEVAPQAHTLGQKAPQCSKRQRS